MKLLIKPLIAGDLQVEAEQADALNNSSANDIRRVDRTFGIGYNDDVDEAAKS